MKFTQVPSQYIKLIQEVQATIKVWAFQTMNHTPADYRLQKSLVQTTDRNRARLPSLFGMKFTQVPSQYSKGIGEVNVTIKVWVHAKAPSRHISCESSSALQLFKQ
jgi:hypothetical protein